MEPTAPLPLDTLARARVYFNLTGQTVLVVIIASRIATSALDKPFSWAQVNTLLITLLLTVILLGAYFAALTGHPRSMDLLRATWRTEKGSRRMGVILLALIGGGILHTLSPDLLGVYIVALPPSLILLWWLRRRATRG